MYPSNPERSELQRNIGWGGGRCSSVRVMLPKGGVSTGQVCYNGATLSTFRTKSCLSNHRKRSLQRTFFLQKDNCKHMQNCWLVQQSSLKSDPCKLIFFKDK